MYDYLKFPLGLLCIYYATNFSGSLRFLGPLSGFVGIGAFGYTRFCDQIVLVLYQVLYDPLQDLIVFS
jgi:hypothetical protein